MSTKPISKLEQQLGYTFSDRELLAQALTHKSVSGAHNERLEYLGDAVLGYLIAESLYLRFPEASEAELTLMRARLVKKEGLAVVARSLQLGRYMTLGSGEMRSGGHERSSLLSNVLEAVLGAVLLDGGEPAARGVVQRIFASRLAETDPAVRKDNKTRLQEWLQGRAEPLPEYVLVETSGADHSKSFLVECRIARVEEPARGEGHSRKAAEQAAAGAMLSRLEAGVAARESANG